MTTPVTGFDFIIIGAGPAGEAATCKARELYARFGVPTSIVQSDPRLAETIYAFPSTSRILNGLFADARRELASR